METQRVSGALGEGPVPRTVNGLAATPVSGSSASPGRASTEYAQYDSQSVRCQYYSRTAVPSTYGTDGSTCTPCPHVLQTALETIISQRHGGDPRDLEVDVAVRHRERRVSARGDLTHAS